MKKISIVLATYNGQKYLNEQLDSLLENEHFNDLVDEIIVSDDNSNDRTEEIVNSYSLKSPLIKFIKNTNNPGVINNFMNGVNAAKNDFIMFCDQDDVWFSNKIMTMHKKMVEMENEYTKDVPLLAFSDLCIVDEKLNVTNPSFLSFHNINVNEALVTERLVLNNVAPGCVSIVNRKLIETAKINDTHDWLMHDWWFMLIASSLGKIFYVAQPLMLYRQHGKNVVGASKKSLLQKIMKLYVVIKDYNKSLYRRRKQATQLLSLLKSLDFKNDKIKSIEGIIESNVCAAKNECASKRKVLALCSFK